MIQPFLFLIFCVGPLTHPLLDKLDQGVFLSYNSYARTLLHQGKIYHLATAEIGHFSRIATVSICSAPFGREIIALDPDNSPYLNQKYAELLPQLQLLGALDQILARTMKFIKHEIFSPELHSEETLYQFIYDWTYSDERTQADFAQTNEGHLFPVMPLDTFARARIGVCRHLAMVCCYFFDKLQNEKSLARIISHGKTYLIRDQIKIGEKIGHHAWNLFIADDKRCAWHIDSTWEILENLARPRQLVQLYGERILQRERQHALAQ